VGRGVEMTAGGGVVARIRVTRILNALACRRRRRRRTIASHHISGVDPPRGGAIATPNQ